MDTLLKILMPIFGPLLKLDTRPPHLPEGTSLVRNSKPAEKWLGYRYLATLFTFLNQFVGMGIAIIGLIAGLKTWGLVIACVLVLGELVAIGFALVVVRVDYEMRHYLVGDRSLRVAQGAWKREEVTLSYANVQNLEVTQGPIERIFGFKSLTVSTAGADSQPGHASSHQVTLVGLENADELRGLILKMMHEHRDAGLGEPASQPGELAPARLLEIREAAVALRQAAARMS